MARQSLGRATTAHTQAYNERNQQDVCSPSSSPLSRLCIGHTQRESEGQAEIDRTHRSVPWAQRRGQGGDIYKEAEETPGTGLLPSRHWILVT